VPGMRFRRHRVSFQVEYLRHQEAAFHPSHPNKGQSLVEKICLLKDEGAQRVLFKKQKGTEGRRLETFL